MKRKLRRSIDITFTIVGVGIIFWAVLQGDEISQRSQLGVVLIGVLLMEAGVWGLAHRLLPSDRKYSSLRAEGDHILGLIRELNHAAIARDRGEEDAKRFQDILAEMHESVTLMADLAAKEDV